MSGLDRPHYRILLVITGTTVGGAEKMACATACYLHGRGHDVSVCSVKPKGVMAQRLEDEGVAVMALNVESKGRGVPGRDLARGMWVLVKFLRKKKIDIVHTFLFQANILGRVAARLAATPVVISSIRTEEMEKTYHLLLDRFSSPLVSQYVAVSDHAKHFTIRRSKTKPEKIVTIYNGVDAQEYGHNPRTCPSFIKSSLGINLRSKVVGTVGRLRKEKGHCYLLQAFAHVARTMKDVTLLVVGEGEDSVRLKRLTDELGLKDHVVFSGLRDDVPDLLRVMDVFVLPSLWEGMPNALLEAMAAKKPVIATSVGGVPEVIVDGKTGLLVPPNDSQALSMALLSLLADENRRRGLGEAGHRRVVEHFSLAQTLARTERLYHEMMVAKKGR